MSRRGGGGRGAKRPASADPRGGPPLLCVRRRAQGVRPAEVRQLPGVVLAAFSCKQRAVCPSCGARRSHGAAIHCEQVLLQVAYRQWTLSAPFTLRWALRLKHTAIVPCGLARAARYWRSPMRRPPTCLPQPFPSSVDFALGTRRGYIYRPVIHQSTRLSPAKALCIAVSDSMRRSNRQGSLSPRCSSAPYKNTIPRAFHRSTLAPRWRDPVAHSAYYLSRNWRAAWCA
jgi:hypothetical protein